MNSFISKKLISGLDLISEELKTARQRNKISIVQAAKITGINSKYLSMLESGNFEALPSGVYGRNFLREYAIYLNVDHKEALRIFDQETSKKNENKKMVFTQKRIKNDFFMIAPKLAKSALVLVLVTLCFAYLGYYIKNIISPPKLIINNPSDNFTTNNHSLKVAGATESEAEVVINGESVLSSPEGAFFKEINLKEGINTISVIAKKKYSRENIITRQVLVKNN